MGVRQMAESETGERKGFGGNSGEGQRMNESLQTKNNSQSSEQSWVNKAVLGRSLDTCWRRDHLSPGTRVTHTHLAMTHRFAQSTADTNECQCM